MALDNILNDLRAQIPFKEKTSVGDIILVGMTPGLFYGVVLDIKPDTKKEWWNVSFKLLVFPPVDITWTLRTPQMNGEIFTSGKEEHFMISLDIKLQRQPERKVGAKPVLSLLRNDGNSSSDDDID